MLKVYITEKLKQHHLKSNSDFIHPYQFSPPVFLDVMHQQKQGVQAQRTSCPLRGVRGAAPLIQTNRIPSNLFLK